MARKADHLKKASHHMEKARESMKKYEDSMKVSNEQRGNKGMKTGKVAPKSYVGR